ncbi:hypothetical protein [Vibrio fluvialis]|uniref:hypothetical protein n=2 Tax=Vibrio fluvialis TaxID=676 RepID=UPI001EEA95F7|nr:hypothetical protein [Vibrio fluvialis]MCG6387578.1 hypothetical protein [Vibrio fluvialis]
MAEQQQQNHIKTGAFISEDGLLRYGSDFYAWLVGYSVSRVREAFFLELSKAKSKVELQVANDHEKLKTMMPIGFMTYEINAFLDFIASDVFIKGITNHCAESIAFKFVPDQLNALSAKHLPRALFAFKALLNDHLESVIDGREGDLSVDKPGALHPDRDVVVKNRNWIVSQFQVVDMTFSQVPKEEEQEQDQPEPADSEAVGA